jgi:hypothetical protein
MHITSSGGTLLGNFASKEDALRAVAPTIKSLEKQGQIWHQYDDPGAYYAWRSDDWNYLFIKQGL